MSTDITALRAKIKTLRGKIADVKDSRLPEADQAAVVDAELDRIEAGYLRAVQVHGRDLALLQCPKDFLALSGFGTGQRLDFIGGAMVRAARDMIRDDLLTAARDWPASLRMSEAERATTLDRLRRELYELEIEDERLVDAGHVTRRDDADPRAVLGLPSEVAFCHLVLKMMGDV